jgi:GNAT superfamily N-acetyltransferase
MASAARVRGATSHDADAIATLLGQLGYPATAPEVAARLLGLEQFPDAIALVADLHGETIGLATGHVFPSIHVSSRVAWLTTLVVSDHHRGSGLGRQLTSAIEEWARARGAVRISVTSGLHRDGAHRFYERNGYERTGLRLTKSLI